MMDAGAMRDGMRCVRARGRVDARAERRHRRDETRRDETRVETRRDETRRDEDGDETRRGEGGNEGGDEFV
jgi:hypothetical protein